MEIYDNIWIYVYWNIWTHMGMIRNIYIYIYICWILLVSHTDQSFSLCIGKVFAENTFH